MTVPTMVRRDCCYIGDEQMEVQHMMNVFI